MNKFSSEHFRSQSTLLVKYMASFGQACNPSNEVCKSYLDDLQNNLDIDNFFWVVNLKEQRIERTVGVCKHLGYSDNPAKDSNRLTLYDIYHFVHEDMQEIIQAQRRTALPHLFEKLKGKIKPLSNDYIYQVIVAFEKKDGKSILVKQKSKAFQLDKDGNMISYISQHVVIRDYKKETPSVEIIIDKERDHSLEELVEIGAQKFITLPFTSTQKAILKVMADYYELEKEDEMLSNKEETNLINQKLGKTLKESTIKVYKKDIKNRAKEKYDRLFYNHREIALFLRKYNLI